MFKDIRLLFFVLGITLLNSCGPVYKTTYNFLPPESETGKMCANNCLQAKTSCYQNCSIQQQSCKTNAQLQAQNNYLQYVNKQQAMGQPVERSQASFYSHYSCTETACKNTCDADHRLCHTNCGGVVETHVYCTANCDKANKI